MKKFGKENFFKDIDNYLSKNSKETKDFLTKKRRDFLPGLDNQGNKINYAAEKDSGDYSMFDLAKKIWGEVQQQQLSCLVELHDTLSTIINHEPSDIIDSIRKKPLFYETMQSYLPKTCEVNKISSTHKNLWLHSFWVTMLENDKNKPDPDKAENDETENPAP